MITSSYGAYPFSHVLFLNLWHCLADHRLRWLQTGTTAMTARLALALCPPLTVTRDSSMVPTPTGAGSDTGLSFFLHAGSDVRLAPESGEQFDCSSLMWQDRVYEVSRPIIFYVPVIGRGCFLLRCDPR